MLAGLLSRVAARVSRLSPRVSRVPVAALGVVIAASALQASCSAGPDSGDFVDAGKGKDSSADSPSEDSPSDRADGMSYGDGYGGTDAHEDGPAGVCTPGAKRCAGNALETCGPKGNWGGPVLCAAETPVCVAGACVTPPLCSPTCVNGHTCVEDGDCASALCMGGSCKAPACSPTCALGTPCGASSDCVSGVCEDGLCAAASCSPSCPDGVMCTAPTACASGVCTGDQCAAPSCAPSCPAGNVCGANGDCASDVCIDGACTVHTYSIGGTVSGLTGIGLVLSDNGGPGLAVTANGAFVFPVAVGTGQPYAVTVASPPAGQSCYVRRASGTVGSAPVADIAVLCRSGLVAYYPFDEGSGTTILDATGNGNDGTTDATYVPGISGTALELDGTNGAIVVGNAAFTWGAANGDYTVDYWVSLTATNANWMSPFHKSDVAGGDCCSDWERSPAQFFQPGSNQLVSVMGTVSDGNFTPVNYPAFTLGKWTHYAEVHDGSSMLVYVNGVQHGPTATLPGETVGGQGTLYLGNDTFYAGLDGRMDEVRIYDVALSAAQVQADMK